MSVAAGEALIWTRKRLRPVMTEGLPTKNLPSRFQCIFGSCTKADLQNLNQGKTRQLQMNSTQNYQDKRISDTSPIE
jgi:hypothetical protein